MLRLVVTKAQVAEAPAVDGKWLTSSGARLRDLSEDRAPGQWQAYGTGQARRSRSPTAAKSCRAAAIRDPSHGMGQLESFTMTAEAALST